MKPNRKNYLLKDVLQSKKDKTTTHDIQPLRIEVEFNYLSNTRLLNTFLSLTLSLIYQSFISSFQYQIVQHLSHHFGWFTHIWSNWNISYFCISDKRRGRIIMCSETFDDRNHSFVDEFNNLKMFLLNHYTKTTEDRAREMINDCFASFVNLFGVFFLFLFSALHEWRDI